MQRLLVIQSITDRIIEKYTKKSERYQARSHLNGVATLCMVLARQRNLDIEICAVAGMLHDIKTYQTGDSTDHGPLGALMAQEILVETTLFSDSEIKTISEMIRLHSKKRQIDGHYPEVLKDADVLNHYFFRNLSVVPKEQDRLTRLLQELNLQQ